MKRECPCCHAVFEVKVIALLCQADIFADPFAGESRPRGVSFCPFCGAALVALEVIA